MASHRSALIAGGIYGAKTGAMVGVLVNILITPAIGLDLKTACFLCPIATLVHWRNGLVRWLLGAGTTHQPVERICFNTARKLYLHTTYNE